jgi:diketogulonate reductase-like aldo/keto reductase
MYLFHAFLLPAFLVAFQTVKLPNGVDMPVILLGTGASTWSNNTSTEQSVSDGLVAGFPGIDGANHYSNQVKCLVCGWRGC